MKRISLGICILILAMATMPGYCIALRLPPSVQQQITPTSAVFSAEGVHPDTIRLQHPDGKKSGGGRQPGGAATVTLTPNTSGYCIGDTIFVPMYVTGNNIFLFNLTIQFDRSLLLPVGSGNDAGWANVMDGFGVLANYEYATDILYLDIMGSSNGANFNGEKIIDLAFTYLGSTSTFHFRRFPDPEPPPWCQVFDEYGIGLDVTYTDCILVPNPLVLGDPAFTAGADTVCQNAGDETYTATSVNSDSITFTVSPVAAGTISASGNFSAIMNWDAAFSGTATITAKAWGCGLPKTVDTVVTVKPLPCSITGASEVCALSTGHIFTAPAGMATYSWTISGLGSISGATNGSTISVNAGASCHDSLIISTTITNSTGCVSTCSRTILVQDTTHPVITSCPANQDTLADVGELYASITLPAPVYTDNCTAPASMVVAWAMTGATGWSGSSLPVSTTCNIGTTIVTYTITDACGNSTSCSFTVVVGAIPPVITPPGDISVPADDGLCSANLDPGSPTLNAGTLPVSYTWAMTGVTTGSGSGDVIGSYTFNVGVTTITWTATNAGGSYSAPQTITVTDDQIPAFTPPSAQTFCVENISTAIFYEPTTDITPERPEYFLFTTGDTRINLDPSTFLDNCPLLCGAQVRWRITFSGGTTFFPPLPALYNVGQPSAYPGSFQLPGSPFGDVVHTISYWIVDCHGNVSLPQTIIITIKPRPDIIKSP